MWKYIIYFDEYVIHFHTGQPQVTATYLADGMLANITAAGATAAWNIANFVLDGCGFTHAEANLHGVRNVGDGAGPLYASTTGPGSSERFAIAAVATTQSRRLPKETRIKSTTVVKPILGRINAPRLPNGRYQKLRPHASAEKIQNAISRPTTSSIMIAATLTSAPDATSTSPMMSSTSTTLSSSYLVSLIYSTYILDKITSNSNLKLNLHKNFIRKFYYPQLILFFDNALSAQPHLYKLLQSVISFSLRFLEFK